MFVLQQAMWRGKPGALVVANQLWAIKPMCQRSWEGLNNYYALVVRVKDQWDSDLRVLRIFNGKADYFIQILSSCCHFLLNISAPSDSLYTIEIYTISFPLEKCTSAHSALDVSHSFLAAGHRILTFAHIHDRKVPWNLFTRIFFICGPVRPNMSYFSCPHRSSSVVISF